MPSDSYPLTSKVQELIAAIQNPLAGAMAGLENVIPTGLTSLEFSARLLKEGQVYASPGAAFGPAGEGYVRISFLSPVRQLEKAMSRFKEVWDKCR